MKPHIHADNSAKQFGGIRQDYLAIHDFIDSSKSAHPTVKHRCILHSSFGIYIVEKVFGHTITNSDGREVSVRDIAEQHVMEDLGFIPTLDQWLGCMEINDWMIRKEPEPTTKTLEEIIREPFIPSPFEPKKSEPLSPEFPTIFPKIIVTD